MADKAITDLVQAQQINDDDLFVLEQNSVAKKLPGKTLLKYVAVDVMTVTVTTLPAGSQATAVYNKQTGNLTLGIPQGATGLTGPAGPANTLEIGSVTSGEVASASITGEAPNQVLNLVLKQGDKGADAPTITNIAIRQSDYHMIVTLSNGTSYDAGYCRGASGAGSGDMQTSVYDPTGKNQDVFAYIDNAIAGIPPPPSASNVAPKAPGTAAAGRSTAYARGDHVHPKELPNGGSTGQVLTKTADGTAWQDTQGGGVTETERKAWDDSVIIDTESQVKLPEASSWIAGAYGNGTFVLVNVRKNDQSIVYSTNGGATWHPATGFVAGAWSACAYGNGKFVALGQGYAAYSTDGITWQQTTPVDSTHQIFALAYGNDKFVACYSGSDVAAYSTDGITWHQTTLPVSSNWRAIAYGNGKFVVTTQTTNTNIALYSTDGINWNQSTLPALSSTSGNWNTCAYGDGKFVAFPKFSTVAAYSTDGITWHPVTLPRSYSVQNLVYAFGKFIGISDAVAWVVYSEDGETWNAEVISPLFLSWQWSNIVFSPNMLICAQYSGKRVIFSEDGLHWALGIPKQISSKTYVDTIYPIARQVTLASTSWNNSSKQITAYVSPIFKSTVRPQLVITTPADTSYNSVWNTCGVQCVKKSNGQLTFQCETIPTEDILVDVIIFRVFTPYEELS